jgi:lipid A 4'-phosphatase
LLHIGLSLGLDRGERLPVRRLLTHPVRANATIQMLDSVADPRTPDHRPTRLRRGIARRPLTFAVGTLLLVSFVFLLAPSIDFATSRLFYDQSTGFVGGSGWLETVRQAGQIVEWCLAIGMTIPIVLKILVPKSPILLPPRASLFALATLAIGPGIIVNAILKTYWGRARPRTVLEFGGDATYSTAWWISDQCQRNCSFVSGEAASAFWLLTIAFLVPKEWRITVAVVTLVFAIAVSFTRIAAGGHFLSDVVIAWLITLCVMIVVFGLTKQLPIAFDRAVEEGAGRWGESLRRMMAP